MDGFGPVARGDMCHLPTDTLMTFRRFGLVLCFFPVPRLTSSAPRNLSFTAFAFHARTLAFWDRDLLALHSRLLARKLLIDWLGYIHVTVQEMERGGATTRLVALWDGMSCTIS